VVSEHLVRLLPAPWRCPPRWRRRWRADRPWPPAGPPRRAPTFWRNGRRVPPRRPPSRRITGGKSVLSRRKSCAKKGAKPAFRSLEPAEGPQICCRAHRPRRNKHHAGQGHGALGRDHGDQRSAFAHAQAHGQAPGERQLQHPEAEEVHNRRRHGVARPIEGLQHHHHVGVRHVAAAEGAQGHRGNRHHHGISRQTAAPLVWQIQKRTAPAFPETTRCRSLCATPRAPRGPAAQLPGSAPPGWPLRCSIPTPAE
jgi:hypothetical protein